MWRINSVFLFMLSILLTNESYGTVIWEENFNTPNLGVWGDNEGESLHINLGQGDNWRINFDDCSLAAENDYVKTVSTSGGRFGALDCHGEAIWDSPWINISKYANVNCELMARETGSRSNPASKYLKAYFQLDDQSDIFSEVNGTNEGNWGEATARQAQLAGDSPRIVVRLNSGYANDKVIQNAFRLWSDQPEVIGPNQLAEAGDVLINEVLFHPYPGGVDLVNNEPAGSEGEWIRTGQQGDGPKSRLGIYIVLLELHDQNGTVRQYKKHAASPTVWNDAATTLNTNS